MDVLIAIHQEGKAIPFSKLAEATGGSISTISSRLGELRADGLIVEKTEDKFGGRRLISLTDKGKRVATLLSKVDEELEK
ncbi:MAG: winged helix-turn-helix transcriptional regulator [Methanobacteriota archaeon]